MCGRFAVITPPEAMRALFAYGEQPNFPARYNIAPTQPIAIVAAEAGKRHFVLMRWGFIPGFVKDEKSFPLIINIRAETARVKPSYRAAFMRRRCLIPADGFYEWRRAGREKQPFLIRRADERAFAFAGLYETWSSPDGSEIDTAAIITTDANGLLAALHQRMPVILDEADHARWLDPATPLDEAETLLRPAPDGLLAMRRVGMAVNKATNEGDDLWRSDDLFSD
jgi:putative SOS response-associated peptidase YedK